MIAASFTTSSSFSTSLSSSSFSKSSSFPSFPSFSCSLTNSGCWIGPVEKIVHHRALLYDFSMIFYKKSNERMTLWNTFFFGETTFFFLDWVNSRDYGRTSIRNISGIKIIFLKYLPVFCFNMFCEARNLRNLRNLMKPGKPDAPLNSSNSWFSLYAIPLSTLLAKT